MEGTVKRKGPALPTWAGLLLLYALFVAVRVALTFFVSASPYVLPDEPLYFNLARSLWTGGEAALRGQPLTYDSLLYPLFLSPLLALPQRLDMFRAIQVVNALALQVAVFPAWALSKRLTGSSRAAWAVALLTLLLPDMSVSRFIIAENIGIPLTLTTLWLAHRALSTRRMTDTVLAAVCAFLLYLVKPGQIALGIALCVCLLVLWLRSRDRAWLLRLGVALGVLAVLYALWQVIARALLGIDYSFVSLYQTQTHAFSLAHLRQTLEGMLLYLFYFPAACLVLPLAVPLAHDAGLDAASRPTLWVAALAILITLIGTCYIIYVDELMGDPFSSRVHLRYVAAYVPVLLAASLSPGLVGKRMNGCLFAVLAYVLAGAVVFSFASLFSGASNPIDVLMLASVTHAEVAPEARKLPQLLLIFGVLVAGYAMYREGWTRRVRGITLALLAVFSLGNNIASYAAHRDVQFSPNVLRDARQVGERLPAGQWFSVAGDGEYMLTSAACLDLHSRVPLATVELGDLMANTAPGGVYAPFVPRAYWRENAVRPTPQAEWAVLDRTAQAQIIFADEGGVRHTAHGAYAMVPVGEDTPWVHSAVSGMQAGGAIGQGATLRVFDAALCAQETIRVELRVRAPQDGVTLAVTDGAALEHAQTLSAGLNTVALDVPAATGGAPVTLHIMAAGDAWVDGFTVEGRTVAEKDV